MRTVLLSLRSLLVRGSLGAMVTDVPEVVEGFTARAGGSVDNVAGEADAAATVDGADVAAAGAAAAACSSSSLPLSYSEASSSSSDLSAASMSKVSHFLYAAYVCEAAVAPSFASPGRPFTFFFLFFIAALAAGAGAVPDP